MLLKCKYKRIFVCCPANISSGGPEALHQMTYYINKIWQNAEIAYCVEHGEEVYINERYKTYAESFIFMSDIIDSKENAIIIPEVYISRAHDYNQADVYVWWLGNDSVFKVLTPRTKIVRILLFPLFTLKYMHNKISVRDKWNSLLQKPVYRFDKEQNNITHLCASNSVFDVIKKKSKRDVLKCIEPISKIFLDIYNSNLYSMNDRNNVVLYNPAKNHFFIRLLIFFNPNISFKSLIGYNAEQLIDIYLHSKLYVDFGPFHGAERMPKEAVLFGCEIITGRHGASNNQLDVCIPQKYKYNEFISGPLVIGRKIQYMFDNYESLYNDFDSYRAVVLGLEKEFVFSLQTIFGECCYDKI